MEQNVGRRKGFYIDDILSSTIPIKLEDQPDYRAFMKPLFARKLLNSTSAVWWVPKRTEKTGCKREREACTKSDSDFEKPSKIPKTSESVGTTHAFEDTELSGAAGLEQSRLTDDSGYGHNGLDVSSPHVAQNGVDSVTEGGRATDKNVTSPVVKEELITSAVQNSLAARRSVNACRKFTKAQVEVLRAFYMAGRVSKDDIKQLAALLNAQRKSIYGWIWREKKKYAKMGDLERAKVAYNKKISGSNQLLPPAHGTNKSQAGHVHVPVKSSLSKQKPAVKSTESAANESVVEAVKPVLSEQKLPETRKVAPVSLLGSGQTLAGVNQVLTPTQTLTHPVGSITQLPTNTRVAESMSPMITPSQQFITPIKPVAIRANNQFIRSLTSTPVIGGPSQFVSQVIRSHIHRTNTAPLESSVHPPPVNSTPPDKPVSVAIATPQAPCAQPIIPLAPYMQARHRVYPLPLYLTHPNMKLTSRTGS